MLRAVNINKDKYQQMTVQECLRVPCLMLHGKLFVFCEKKSYRISVIIYVRERERQKIKYSKREVSIKEMNEDSNTEGCSHQIRRQKRKGYDIKE